MNWVENLRKLKNVPKGLIADEIFREALNLTIDYAVDEWLYRQGCKGRYYPDGIRPAELIVSYKPKTKLIHIRHWLNPFIRMTENVQISINVITEEKELFGY